MKKAILFVDDEMPILNSLKRAFFSTDYKTFFATSTKEAYLILEKNVIDMIVSDMRMPDENGYEFLKNVRTLYPSIIRIILSGYSEKEIVIKAISNGVAKLYLTKPWDNKLLKAQLCHLFEIHSILTSNNILSMLKKIDQLPILSSNYTEYLRLLQEDKSVGEISNLLQNDPGLVMRILKISNASFYGVSIFSINQAIIYLGLDTIKNIILCSDIFESFKIDEQKRADVEYIWSHSILCNKILHTLYNFLYSEKLPEQFSAIGLLHDIGKLIFVIYYSSEYHKVLEQWDYNSDSICDLELKYIGLTHAQTGAYLLDWWNLPTNLIDACMYHHNPLQTSDTNRNILSLTNIADTLTWQLMGKLEKKHFNSDKLVSFDDNQKEIINQVTDQLFNGTISYKIEK